MDWKKVISTVAPAIGGVIGGPFGPLVGEGLKTVSEVLLGKPDGSEEELGAAVAKGLTPEAIATLQEKDQAFRLELEKLSVERDRIEAGDRSSARDMQKAALQQDDKVAKRFVYEFAAFITAIAFIYIFTITFLEIPEKNVRFADTILGFMLGTLVATVVNFFYGSSSGSARKTSVLESVISRKDRA